MTLFTIPRLRCERLAAAAPARDYHLCVDSNLGVPGTAAARERFAFPLARGLIDPTCAVASVEVVMLRSAESKVNWDGHTLVGLKDKVAYVQG